VKRCPAICGRCTGYQNIVDAMLAAAQAMQAPARDDPAFFFGRGRFKRNEDRQAFLTGQGLFIDDCRNCPACCTLPSCAARWRMPRIKKYRRPRRALKRPRAWWRSTPPTISAPTGSPGPVAVCRRHPSPELSFQRAKRRCRWQRTKSATVGEPLAVIVAGQPLHIAEDALDDIDVDPRNPAGGWSISKKGLDAGSTPMFMTISDPILPRKSGRPRATIAVPPAKADSDPQPPVFGTSTAFPSPIETRGRGGRNGTRAQPDQMTIWDTTQAPGLCFANGPRRHARPSGERQVRVIAPFVGGGFLGPKIMMFLSGRGPRPGAVGFRCGSIVR